MWITQRGQEKSQRISTIIQPSSLLKWTIEEDMAAKKNAKRPLVRKYCMTQDIVLVFFLISELSFE